jgi:hypothetical protein
MPSAINTHGTALTSTPWASGSRLAAACAASNKKPAEMHKRTSGQATLAGAGGGTSDVVGADEERYEGDPGRGGSEDGGGAKEGGSVSIARPAIEGSA